MKALLVTGGCGFIGSHFIRLILRERPDLQVLNVDLLTYAGTAQVLGGSVENVANYRFFRADIADSSSIDAIFASDRVDAIVNFAAESHVDRSLSDSAPFLRTNVEGTRVLLEAGCRYGVQRFLQVSTDEVYGSLVPADPPFTEESPLKPNSPYAATKASADLLMRAYHHSYGLPVLITRCSNNYGSYQFPEKFLPVCITNALDNRPVPLYGDGQQIRDWIHVADHVQALLLVLEKGRPGEIYNISAQEERINQKMAEWVLDLVGKPRDLIRHIKDRPGHDRRYVLSSEKIRRELGWQPAITLDTGLPETVRWYKEQRAWWERIKNGELRP